MQHDLDNLGGHSGGDTPLPIPNREVKPASADGTRGASPRESRTPPSLYPQVGNPLVAGFRPRGSLKASAVAAACHALRASASFLDCSLWSFATAISCFVRGRRTMSMPSSPVVTTQMWRGGSRRFRLRIRRRMRWRSSEVRSRRTSRALAMTVRGAVVGGIGLTVDDHGLPRHDRILGRGARTRAGHVHACPASALTIRPRRARASTARSRHRSRQRRVATCGREGRVPQRGRPSLSPATSGRSDSRLGDVLAATRRASRVTNRGPGHSSRLRARADAVRDRRAVGAS